MDGNTILVLQKRRWFTAVYLVNDDDWPLWINEDDAARHGARMRALFSSIFDENNSMKYSPPLPNFPPKFRRPRSRHHPRLKIELERPALTIRCITFFLPFLFLSFQRPVTRSSGKKYFCPSVILSFSY